VLFEIVGPIKSIEVIATGSGVRTRKELSKRFGHSGARWRKLKGLATVRLMDTSPGTSLRKAEVHWYEAHGIGKVLFKIKRYVD